jgi:hypothetical protein
VALGGVLILLPAVIIRRRMCLTAIVPDSDKENP